jgi:hypothetical protein
MHWITKTIIKLVKVLPEDEFLRANVIVDIVALLVAAVVLLYGNPQERFAYLPYLAFLSVLVFVGLCLWGALSAIKSKRHGPIE